MKTIYQISKTVSKKAVEKKIQFIGEVVFGIPSRNCKNFGICRISQLDMSLIKKRDCKTCNEHTALALIAYLTTNDLEMFFLRSSMHTATNKKFFSEEYFRVEENYQLSVSLENNEINYNIVKGVYPILETSIYYIVRF